MSKNQPTRAAVRMTRSSLGRIQTGSGRTGGTILSPRGDQSDLDVSHGRILYESPSSYPSEGYSQPVENSLGPSPVGSPRRSKSAPRGTVSSPPSGSVPKSTRASSPTGIPSTDSVRKFSPSREYASAVLGDTSSTPYQREPDIPVRPQRGIRAPPVCSQRELGIIIFPLFFPPPTSSSFFFVFSSHSPYSLLEGFEIRAFYSFSNFFCITFRLITFIDS